MGNGDHKATQFHDHRKSTCAAGAMMSLGSGMLRVVGRVRRYLLPTVMVVTEVQSFRVDGVEITISAETVDASRMQAFVKHGRAVTAVAREFAEGDE